MPSSSSNSSSELSPGRSRGRLNSPSSHALFEIGANGETSAEAKVYASQALTNKNVNWMSSTWFWLAYIFAIAIARGLTYIIVPKPYDTPEVEWTLVNVTHAMISFFALHWNRGSPIWDDQGEHANHTVWEQIDNGTPWTPTHKFLLIVPVLLFLTSLHFTHYEIVPFVVNIVALVILVIPKLPEMHEMRFFGINAGPKLSGQE
jgi:hypothetical protein